jgi:hypothetical protein
MANKSEGEVRAALVAALIDNPRQLGEVYKLDPDMNLKAKNIVELEGAANESAVGNLRCSIRAILDGVIPNSPTVSTQAIGSLRGLVRDNRDFPPDVMEHLNEVLLELQDRAESKVFKEVEAEVRRHGSKELLQLVEQRGGVYAYSLPHYLNFPCKEDPERYWFKVGCTKGNFEDRVISSHRQTSLPEDPVIRRTYFSKSLDPRAMEKKFHKMLEASGLRTEANHGGVEWFATTESQLDAIAELLGFEVSRPDEVDEA